MPIDIDTCQLRRHPMAYLDGSFDCLLGWDRYSVQVLYVPFVGALNHPGVRCSHVLAHNFQCFLAVPNDRGYRPDVAPQEHPVPRIRFLGVGAGLRRAGLRHEGLYVSFDRRRHRIDFAELTGGKAITVYGQNEVVRDLIEARTATARSLYFEAEDVSLDALDSSTPRLRFRHAGADHEIRCDFIAGCDGFHGICRPSIPPGVITAYERTYPFGWLAILAEAAPSCDELVYTYHERGFALFSMRSPTLVRLPKRTRAAVACKLSNRAPAISL